MLVARIPLLRLLAVACVAGVIAACATAPVAVDLTPPPKKPLDAKTQLETGRRF